MMHSAIKKNSKSSPNEAQLAKNLLFIQESMGSYLTLTEEVNN